MELVKEHIEIDMKDSLSVDTFEYMNSLGIIFNNEIVLHQYNSKIPINIKRIRRVFIEKKRSFLLNACLIITSILIFFAPLLFDSRYNYMLNVFFGSIILLVGFVLRIKNYRLILILENDISKIDLNKVTINEAKKIVSLINKKIKRSNQRK